MSYYKIDTVKSTRKHDKKDESFDLGIKEKKVGVEQTSILTAFYNSVV